MNGIRKLAGLAERWMPLFLVLVDQAVISGTRLVIQIVVGYGAPDQLGLLGIALGVVVVMVSFQEALVTTPYTVFSPRQKAAASRAFSAGALWTQTLLMVATVAVWSGVVWYRSPAGEPAGPMLVVLSAVVWYAPLHLLREFARRHLLAHGRRRTTLVLDLLAAAVVLVWPGVLLWGEAITARQAFTVLTAANLLYVGLWVWQNRGQFPLSGTNPRQFLGLSWSYGRWIVGENLCSALTIAWMGWYLAWWSGERQAGLFQSCITVVLLANPFLLGFAGFFGPRAAEVFHLGGWRPLLQLTGRSLVFVTAGLASLSALLWPMGEWVLTTLFGEEYAGNGGLVGILSLGMVGLGISHVLAVSLQTSGRPQINFAASLTGFLCVVGWSFFLVQDSLVLAAIGFVTAVFAGVLVRAAGIWLLEPGDRFQPSTGHP